ncbi:hypothetical protein H2203_006146 [Taxawa tesnikishii (nom. ined.)]|nr:hypothetical protein H2203_006146 [Dothideales sp. JES 119]
MPAYEVEYICPLSEGQRDELAAAITKIHAEQFGAPSLLSTSKRANRILASVRHGPSRTQEDYAQVSKALAKAWDEIVPLPQVKRSSEAPDTELRLVLFFGSIVAGYEAGFVIPQAGKDKEWLQENMSKFQERADAGDEDIKDLLAEVKARSMV